jgi:hypothetical protein
MKLQHTLMAASATTAAAWALGLATSTARVDCRTRTCLAELDFNTFADARAQLGRIVVQTNLEGCGSTGHIAPTDDPTSRSKMRLLFDCNRSQLAR